MCTNVLWVTPATLMSLVQLPQQVERWWRAPRQGTSPHCDFLALTSDQLWLAVWILSEHLDHSPMKYIPSMETMEGENSFCQAHVCRVWHWSQEAAISCGMFNLSQYMIIYVLVCMVGSQPMDCSILCIFAMRSQQKRMLRLSRWRIAARFCPTALVPCPELLAT